MTADGSRAQSTRLVARQLSELFLGRGEAWASLTPRDYLDSLIYLTVLGGSIAHLPLRDAETGRWFAVEDAELLGRPVSVAAVAQSLVVPYTTVRRRCAAMARSGQLRCEATGFQVAAAFSSRLYAGETTRGFARCLEALGAAGYAPAQRALAADVLRLPPGVAERMVIAFQLRTLEPLTRVYGDVADAMVVAAIVAANVRHITADVALARRYAAEDRMPPDDVRRPIAVRELARDLRQPFETTRRRVAALVDRAVVVRHDEGVVVPTRVLAGPDIAAYNRRMIGFLEQMLDTMVAAAAAL